MRKSIRSEPQALLIRLLREARETAGLRQEDVALRLGRTHQSFVAKYEAGQRRIDVVEFITLAKALEVDPVRLLRRLVAAADAATDKRGRKKPG